MRRLTATQLAVIGAAVISTVLLSLVHTWPAQGKREMPAMAKPSGSPTLEQVVAADRAQLKSDLQQMVATAEASVASERDANKRSQMFDTIIRQLDSQKHYVLAAWFTEQRAVRNNGKSSDWELAGEHYRNAAQFQQDENSIPALYEAARRCYDKALELDAKNLDAKVGVAICLVEASSQPQNGISMLLDVVKEDSTNVNAQLALGDFSVKRGAPDKAIIRYSNALRLRPDYYGLHLNIADLCLQTGDTNSAIVHLKDYARAETDPVMKNDVENEIRALESKKPEK